MKRSIFYRRPKPRLHGRTAAKPGVGRRFDFKKFWINLAVFAVLTLALQYAELSRRGQEILDHGYDDLIRANFKEMVLQGGDPVPISPDLRLVLLGDSDYTQSYTKGYWTPREEVGRAILNSLKRGAKVVIVDFSFAGEAPVVMENNQPIDGTKKFLELLTEGAELARTTKAIILVPIVSSPPPKGYSELLGRYRDVFRLANFESLRDEHDGVVRRLRWFSYSNDYAPILSASLLAALLSDHNNETAAVSEAKGLLVGAQNKGKLLPPSLVRALRPEEQKASSRLIYRLLPRATVAREFGSGPDATRGVVWRPQQIASTMAEPDFNSKIVLIGSDYQGNGDFHQTAFGPLPGSYILGNSLNMVLTEKMIEEARGLNLTLLILTGLIASALIAYFQPAFITLILLVLTGVKFWPSAWVFNRYGLFLDVWLPALCVSFYRLIADRWNLGFGPQGLFNSWLNWKPFFGPQRLLRQWLRL